MNKNNCYINPWWLPTAHLQTIYPFVFLRGSAPAYLRRRLDTKDGDFLDLDWIDAPRKSPTIIIFHGLEGSSQSHYTVALVRSIQAKKWGAVVPHFRGCSGVPNKLARAYHAGDHKDIEVIIRHIRKITSGPVFAVGISLGGSALLNWLARNDLSQRQLLHAAAVVSVPLDLNVTGGLLEKGVNKIYSWFFLKSLKKKCLIKANLFKLGPNTNEIRAIKTLREFDDKYTAPVHGFLNVEDYWTRASAQQWLTKIQTDTLIIHARNDPLFPEGDLPVKDKLPKNIRCYYTREGGHVGFTTGNFPGNINWLPKNILDYFQEFLF